MIKRRPAVRAPGVLFARLFGFLFGLAVALPGVASQPNVLIVYVDDLGYGDTSVYGHPVIETPVIDQLARDGVRFTQFYAPSALCSPSRAGLLTGRTPYRTGIESWIPDDSPVALNPDEFTIAELLKKQGFRTAVIGKWHLNGGLGMTTVPQPKDFGFDYQYGLAAWVKNTAVEAAGTGKLYPDNMYRDNQPVGSTEQYSAALISDAAIEWLGNNTAGTPFFLLLTYSEVHTPIASPPAFTARYDQYLTDESRSFPDRYYMQWRDRPNRGKGEYYANVSFMDFQLGRVIDHLEATGELDNTLVIFSSDNGPVTAHAEEPWEIGMAGETDGLRGKKRYLHEGGIRVPGIMRWPAAIPAGITVDEPATALDMLPTISELLDVPVPNELVIDGQSIAPLLDDDPATVMTRKQVFYWSLPTPDGLEYAVRDGDWKLLLDGDGSPAQLYNLKTDRYELYNQLTVEPDIAARLSALFRDLRAEIETTP